MSSVDLNRVPHLITSLKGPLQKIEKHLLSHETAIEDWFRDQFNTLPIPIYSSVDLRNAGFKIAPVDTNLFPAGFNNLNTDLINLCAQAVQETLKERGSSSKELILIPEDHTRNIHYYENIAILKQIFSQAGYDVRIGSLLTQLKSAKTIALPSGNSITLEPVERRGDRLMVGNVSPDLILLNNDLSSGIPDILQGLTQQTIMPPPSLGWSTRLKSDHFTFYDQVVGQFSQQFDLDPWLLSSLFQSVDNVNFTTKEGEDRLMGAAEQLLTQISQKYEHYQINAKPFVIVKADAGTYGMAVMTLHDPSQFANMNRKDRSRMASIKGGKEVNRVILQEGVYTNETFGASEATTEPVVYMIGRHVVGGFYRVHDNKEHNESLNAPGMYFEPLMPAASEHEPATNRFYAYGVIARLALMAAARELQATTGR